MQSTGRNFGLDLDDDDNHDLFDDDDNHDLFDDDDNHDVFDDEYALLM